MKVWREGIRIRDEDGVGYADSVEDAMIWENIDAARAGRPGFNADFAEAVLRFRAIERSLLVYAD
jgi:hypothetical protein